MGWNEKVRSLRNAVDFKLRSLHRWGRRVHKAPAEHQRAQRDLHEFLSLLPWETLVWSKSSLVVADIGAQSFLLAEVVEKCIDKLGLSAEIHGIEIDAFRRLINFRTRYDYGQYYASRVRHGFYHPIDILQWKKPMDLAFLLNPFVTKEPLLRWGLPLSKFCPEAIFRHVHSLLKPNRGYLILSCPTLKEFGIATAISERVGFVAKASVRWVPDDESFLVKPRFGGVLIAS